MMMTRSQPVAWVRICCARLLPMGFLMIACAASVKAETESPAPASVSKPEPSDRSRIPSSSVSRTEIGQLEQLILNQNAAIEDLKAKLDRQQSLIDKLLMQRSAEMNLSPDSPSTAQAASLSAVHSNSISSSPGVASASNSTAQTNSSVAPQESTHIEFEKDTLIGTVHEGSTRATYSQNGGPVLLQLPSSPV